VYSCAQCVTLYQVGYKLTHCAQDYTPALRTTATTPSAEHHIQQHTTCTPEDGHRDVRNL